MIYYHGPKTRYYLRIANRKETLNGRTHCSSTVNSFYINSS